METLKELREYGESLGLRDGDLVKFIETQQAKQREDRHLEREREKEMQEWEIEKVRLDHELEMRRLENTKEIELEKQKEEKGKKNPTHVPKLPHFDENTDDMDSYLSRFERYATSQNWDKCIWATHLSALLKGKALDVYALLPPEQALNFEALKTSLLKRFNMTEDGFKHKFRSCRPESGETFEQYSVRLGGYFSRWIDMSEIPKTYEGLYDLMLRDQFLHVCNNEVMLFLKERVPKSIDDMTKYADQFKEARRVNITTLTHQVQKGKSNTSSHKPNISKSQDSVKVSDKGSSNNNNQAGRSSGYTRKCFKCSKTDHIISNCPLLKNKAGNVESTSGHETDTHNGKIKNSGKNKPVCSNVMSLSSSTMITTQVSNLTLPSDSTKIRMPVEKGELGNHEVTVLRDTGCNGAVVRRCLVSKDDFLDEYQTCALADGSSIEVPVAVVKVVSPYYEGELKAWCLEDPLYDVIIGNIEGAREPFKPDLSYRVSVVTRQQAKAKEKPYPKLKVPDTLDHVSTEDIKQAQQSDQSLSKIRQYVKEGKMFKKPNGTTVSYKVKKTLLYRQFQSPNVEKGKTFCQLVVPVAFRGNVMKLAHESLMAGHLATRRTVSRILTEFYWPGVEADTKRYCRSCDICQKTVPKGKQVKAPLGKMPIIDVPFRRVAVDLVGPLVPITDKGNRYILTIVDYATRYPEAVALPSIETERVAEALIEVFCRVGFPREMLTDMGTQFTSDLMSEVSRLISLRQLTTTPYHAMCNGLVERFNGTMKMMLKRLCAERPRDWDKYLGPALFAYREVPQESIAFSPFELMYGWPVRGPMTILKELWTKEISDPEVRSTYEYVINLRERLESTCELVKQNLQKASKKQARIYNRRSRSRKLKVGQKVLVLLPTKANKLLMHWKGPFTVVEKVTDLDYRIDMEGKIKMFHLNMLKLYVERESTSTEVDQSNDKVNTIAAVSVIDFETEDIVDCNDYEGELIESPVSKSIETTQDVHINESLEDEQRSKVQCLLDKYSNVLSDIPGKTNVLEHDIKLTCDEPIRVKPYPIPYAMIETVNKELDNMIDLDVIEKSDSPYSSPFLIVKKKDQSNRFVIDFRKINSYTVFDAETMGNIDEMFAKLSGYKFISKLDLTKGYWQIGLADGAKEKTAFQTPRGLFHFKVLPFGLVNSGASFVRCMRKVLEGLENVDNFVDDIILYTMTFDHHLEVLGNVLERLAIANLTAKPSKCHIGYHSLEVLGHIVGSDRLSPNPDKIEVIKNASRPKTKKQVRSFLGLAEFYRKFVKDFSRIASPLTDLTKKGCPNQVRWEECHENAFSTLKNALIQAPVLKIPNFSQIFILQTDACDTGIGSILLQEEDNTRMPICYASKKLKASERNYSTIEKECLAIVWAINKFHRYLYGKEFILETDHQPLAYLQRSKIANARLMRWSLLLQQYRFRIVAIRGKDNVGADYMSRM